MTNEILRRGAPAKRPAPIPLRAGPWTALFEPDSGWLRHLRLGDHEAVRAIYAAVRDLHWNTIPTALSHLQFDLQPDAFRIEFEARCDQDPIRFHWRGALTGHAEGRIAYAFDGVAESRFLRNRIGICVLHPVEECAGKICRVEKVDGRIEEGVFPRTISPHQPFCDIRALTYEPAPGVKVAIRFEGDTFEMEDQRNWTDASYKTYSTPLDLPFPVEVKPGARIRQEIVIDLPKPQRRILPILQGRGAQLSIATTPVLPKPPLGLEVASHGQPLTSRELDRLKVLGLSHLRLTVDFKQLDWPERLAQAGSEAAQLGCALHVALLLGEAAEADLAALARVLPSLAAGVALWLVFDRRQSCTPPDLLALARKALGGKAGSALFAAGSQAHFTELNRNRPALGETALPCYSVTPQAHALDDMTLVENLAAQPLTVEATRQFAPRAVVISPITLRPRLHPDQAAAVPVSKSGTTFLPSNVDPRQISLFGAGWTLGSLARLSAAGNLHSLTYFETTGWLGIMEAEGAPDRPEAFPSLPGAVFPVYHLLADLAGYERIYPTRSSHPLQMEGLTLVDSRERRRILVANYQGDVQEIRIKSGTCQAWVRPLNETNVEQALRHPESFRAERGELVSSASGKLALTLQPYSLARVDIV